MHNPVVYLVATSYKNQFKQWLRKPLKFLLTIAWIGFMLFGFLQYPELLRDFGIVTPEGFVALISLFVLYISAPSFLSYFKRKGIVFTYADVNFIFATPVSAKSALVYGLSKSIVLNAVMGLAVMIVAVVGFEIPILSAVIYFLGTLFIGDLGEYSLAVILYGSEKLTEKTKNILRYAVYILMASVVLWVVFRFLNQGFSLELVYSVLGHPIILLIPFLGWKIGFASLIFLGYTPIRLLSSVLFVLGSLFLYLYVRRMKLDGEYYEDAMTFADDYQVALEESQKGGIGVVGKKQKTRATNTVLKGSGATSIFYKHLLEFRKQHRFPLRLRDIVILIGGVALAYFISIEPAVNIMYIIPLILMGIQIYFKSIFAQFSQWRRDFDHYLIYLIPDTNFRKVFYATLIDHLTGLIQTLFLILPMAIYNQWPFIHVLLTIILMTLVRAAGLYFSMFFKEILGRHLGMLLEAFVSAISEIVVMGLPLLIAGILIGAEIGNPQIIYGALVIFYLVICVISLWVVSRTLTHIVVMAE